MIKIIAGFSPSVSNHLLLKMQIIKSTPPFNRESFIRDTRARFLLDVFAKCFVKIFSGTRLQFFISPFEV